jgi:NAD+ diphosphatase
VLLGSLDGVDHWALATAGGVESGTVPGEAGGPGPGRSLRALGPLLPDADAGFATSAVALLGWHAWGGFCPRCGQPSVPDLPGHSRTCPDGHQEFPRTDPAVIVLVHDGTGNAVLARQPGWAPGRVSVLAGFVEAGESLEATVVREIREEIGVDVTDVAYLGSQPWPFPRSLMIGFAARVGAGTTLHPRVGEIERAEWFSRDRIRSILAGSDDGGVSLPDSVSIARRMVEGFVAR